MKNPRIKKPIMVTDRHTDRQTDGLMDRQTQQIP